MRSGEGVQLVEVVVAYQSRSESSVGRPLRIVDEYAHPASL